MAEFLIPLNAHRKKFYVSGGVFVSYRKSKQVS